MGAIQLGKVFSSREVIRILEDAGWCLHRINGDHHHFIYPSDPTRGIVTVPHPKKDLNKAILASIARQSGIKF